MKLIWTYLKRYPIWLLIDLLAALLFVVVNLGLPTLLAKMIDLAITPGRLDQVYFWAQMMGLVVILGFVGRVLLSYASSYLTTHLVEALKNDANDQMLRFSHEGFDQFGIASLVTRQTQDAFVVMQFAEQALRMGIITPMMMVTSVIMIFITAPSLAWIVAVAIPFLLLVIAYVAIKTKVLSERQQKNLDKINQYVRENLTGLRVIRAFAREEYQEERFDQVNGTYAGLSRRLFTLTGLTEPLFVQIIVAMIVAIVWFALSPLLASSLQIGDLVAFVEYSFHALFSFLIFANLFTLYPRMTVSAHRLEEVLEAKPMIQDPKNGVTKTETAGVLTFDHVTFGYPGKTEEPVLEDISFTAKPGQTVAFIGSTGSGKSTIVNLIPRFYDVTFGRILLDGVDVRDYKLSALRDKLGVVPQKAVLFTGTIADNLRFGKPDASQADLEAAVDIAQASAFIQGTANGFETHLAEGGSNLSGGQKQRLSIARALVKKPSLYIFDDSFSALDYQTDAQLRKRLKEVTQDATVLIVAQRVGTIRQADQIIVLDQGKIIGRGTHEELLETCSVYREIAESQLKDEEKGGQHADD
ncbi:ABC transporter ATP-binding protein [Streptococcus sp. DD12]|uniref:ABC transporter ATP-binding protein n=1 Tax=Streptococcus sp. DD12 TaxID=1777880 RepID=UPI00079A6E3C|nr:ABC transporter ATP-binding protein [Streptococcus sp. DD12]KXT76479.1 ABC transporter, ATP-binding/permease protein [Streptococcus sp. DD12]